MTETVIILLFYKNTKKKQAGVFYSHKRTVILTELPCFFFCAMMNADEAEGLSALLDDRCARKQIGMENKGCKRIRI